MKASETVYRRVYIAVVFTATLERHGSFNDGS